MLIAAKKSIQYARVLANYIKMGDKQGKNQREESQDRADSKKGGEKQIDQKKIEPKQLFEKLHEQQSDNFHSRINLIEKHLVATVDIARYIMFNKSFSINKMRRFENLNLDRGDYQTQSKVQNGDFYKFYDKNYQYAQEDEYKLMSYVQTSKSIACQKRLHSTVFNRYPDYLQTKSMVHNFLMQQFGQFDDLYQVDLEGLICEVDKKTKNFIIPTEIIQLQEEKKFPEKDR